MTCLPTIRRGKGLIITLMTTELEHALALLFDKCIVNMPSPPLLINGMAAAIFEFFGCTIPDNNGHKLH